MNPSRTASQSFQINHKGRPSIPFEHGSFAWFVRSSNLSSPNDPALPSHPIVVLDHRYRLPGHKYDKCHPCLVITKKPLRPRDSMPLAPWHPKHHAVDRMLHQRTDGRYAVHTFKQNNHVSFAVKMIARADLHPIRRGKRDVYAGLRADSLRVVERELAARAQK